MRKFNIGLGVSSQYYEEMIEKYPEHFKEILEYRAKWKAIPEEVKDSYFKSIRYTAWEKEVEGIGKAPYPELIGLGIIARVNHWGKPNSQEIEQKYLANEAWLKKVSNYRHKKDIDSYNEHFNKYGLKREYDEPVS